MGLKIDRLKALRQARGWSQRELGRRCGFAESLIGQYESELSDPSTANLTIMADLFGVSTDYLLGRSDDPIGSIVISELTEEERALVATYRKGGLYGVIRLVVDRLEGKGEE